MVKGLTAVERAAARAAKKRRERRKYFADEARTAPNGRATLRHACRFAQAVGERELDDAGRRELAARIVAAILSMDEEGGDGR